MSVKEIFGERIKSLRLERGLSQEAFSKAIGISRISLGYYEKAERTADIEVFSRIAEVFDVSYNYLLGKTDAKTSTHEEMTERLGLGEEAIILLEFKDPNMSYLIEQIILSGTSGYLAQSLVEFNIALAGYIKHVLTVIENAVMFEPKSEEEINLIRGAVWENLITRDQCGRYMNGQKKPLYEEIEEEVFNMLEKNGYSSVLLTRDEYMNYRISETKKWAEDVFSEMLEEVYSDAKTELAEEYYEKILKEEIKQIESGEEEEDDGEYHETDE